MKKKYLLLVVACCTSLLAFSQAKPFYTQYILNNYILNPGVTGIENYTDVKLSYRNQWTGINGSPVTTYFSMHTALGKKDYATSATSFEVPGENPRGKRYWEEYTAPAPHHGIGFMAINDKTGFINRWSIAASYAYHKPLGVKTTLSAGINMGVSSVNLDRDKIDFGTISPDDPAVGYDNGEIKKIKPELGAGLWLYSSKYFVGLSVLNIIPGKSNFVEGDQFGTYFTPNYFLTAGYRFFLSDDVSVLPSVMVQYWEPQFTGVHTNVKFQYRDLLWLGASFRYADLISGYSAMAGINVSNAFNISYAYEAATTARLRTYTKNTHEIMFGFLIGNKYNSNSCPRNIW